MDVGVLVGQRPPPQDLEPVLARLVIQRVSSRTGHVIVPRPPVGHPFPHIPQGRVYSAVVTSASVHNAEIMEDCVHGRRKGYL